jgi:5-formyltetrahydrofolate cyclo-ligase
MVNQKEIIRKSIKSVLLNVTPLEINEATEKVFNSLINHSSFTLSKTVCIYLAMSKEVQTLPLIRYAFQSNKRVIIPKITGKSPSDMFMLEVESMERILSFPLSNWGIPEPSLDYIATKNDETESGTIDMIYVPGVAFDPKCGRLGHGRAYYGK